MLHIVAILLLFLQLVQLTCTHMEKLLYHIYVLVQWLAHFVRASSSINPGRSLKEVTATIDVPHIVKVALR